MIAVVYGARTGSTYLAKKIAQDHDYEYLGEIFNPVLFTRQQTYEAYSMIHDNTACLFKVCGQQMFRFPDINLIELLLKCDQVIFTLRMDFNAQVRSTYVGRMLKRRGIGFHEEFTNTVDVEYLPQEYQRTANDLVNRYHTNSDIFQNVKKAQVAVYENFATPEHRLRRPVRITPPLPHLDFNPMALFGFDRVTARESNNG